MQNLMLPKINKWPFFVGDILLLLVAVGISFRTTAPLGVWEMGLVAACVALGAWLAVLPFLLEYRAAIKITETAALSDVVSQIGKMETVAEQIRDATEKWQTVQEHADKTARASKDIFERMAVEVKGFSDFMQKANDSERATLRLELDKLRRGEAEWLQVVVHMLDHVYALTQGALRSGQPRLIDQMGHFQNACRDAARRVGLSPFQVERSQPFDAEKHRLVDGDVTPASGARVAETIATGFTFQGRLVRPALVSLESGEQVASNASPLAPESPAAAEEQAAS